MDEQQKIVAANCQCCDCKDCGGFKKFLESKGGLTIYQETSEMVNSEEVGSKSRDSSNKKEAQLDDNIVITIHNTRDTDLNSSDFFEEFDINKVNCPRCRAVMTRARLILEKMSVIEKNEIKSVCDSCLKSIQQKSLAPCHHCQKSMKRFESRIGKQATLMKQLLSILADEKIKVEIAGTGKELKSYSDIDMTRSKYYDSRFDRPKSTPTTDSKILASLLKKKTELKKPSVRVKIRDVPEKVRSLEEFELKDIYSTDKIARTLPKPILKPAIERPLVAPPQSPVLPKEKPYRSGLRSETVLGIGTTGIRRARSNESLLASYTAITDEISMKSFKYVFPRRITRAKTIATTSAELIRETHARFQAEAQETIRKREELIEELKIKRKYKELQKEKAKETFEIIRKQVELQDEEKRNRQEKELQKLITIGDKKKIEEWAKREGINMLDIDTNKGKIKQRKKEDIAKEIDQKIRKQEELKRNEQESELKKVIATGDVKNIKIWALKQGISMSDLDIETGKIKQIKKEDITKEIAQKITKQEEQKRNKQEKELKKVIATGDIKNIEKWAKKQAVNMSDLDIKTGKIKQRKKEGITKEIDQKIRIQEELKRDKHEKELKNMIATGNVKNIEKWAKKQGINMSDLDIETGKIKNKEKKIKEEIGKEYDIEKHKKAKKKERAEDTSIEYDSEKKTKIKKREVVDWKKLGKEFYTTGTEKPKKDKHKDTFPVGEKVISGGKKKKIIQTEDTAMAKGDRKKNFEFIEKGEKLPEKLYIEKGAYDKSKGTVAGKLKGTVAGASEGAVAGALKGTAAGETKGAVAGALKGTAAGETKGAVAGAKEKSKEKDTVGAKTEEAKATQTPRSVASGPDQEVEQPFISESDIDLAKKDAPAPTKKKDGKKQAKGAASNQTVEQINLVKNIIGKHEKVKTEANKLKKTQAARLVAQEKRAEKATQSLNKSDSLKYVDLKAKKKREQEERKTMKKEPSRRPTGGKEEVELSAKNIKMVVSGDNIILQLVKTRSQKTEKVVVPPPPPIKVIHVKRKLRRSSSETIGGKSDIELDAESLLRKQLMKVKKEENEVVFGQNIILKKDIPPEPEPKKQTALFQTKFNERVTYVKINEYESEVDHDDQGPFCYALSDRKYIANGWTKLPTEKIVRKMNIYRMRPSHTTYDWFEHNKNIGALRYESGEKLAVATDRKRGRWYYRNGRTALDYYESEEANTQQRFLIYSSGEPDERGRSQPVTILAMFDYLGNGIVFDHRGKIRLKYNQSEGVLLDRDLGPNTHWLWHSLNEPPELQQVMIDTQLPYKDPAIYALKSSDDRLPRQDDETMLAIEFENYIKSSQEKPAEEFKRHQIRMKALKINEHFSLKVIDQETIFLIFRDGLTTMKLNLGMKLDHKELLDTSIAELNEVSLNIEKRPAVSDSLEDLQKSLNYTHNINRVRAERELKLRPRSPASSTDKMFALASKPHPPMLPTDPSSTLKTKCKTLPTNNLYYNTRLI